MTNNVFDGPHFFPGIILFSAKATSGQPYLNIQIFLYILRLIKKKNKNRKYQNGSGNITEF